MKTGCLLDLWKTSRILHFVSEQFPEKVMHNAYRYTREQQKTASEQPLLAKSLIQMFISKVLEAIKRPWAAHMGADSDRRVYIHSGPFGRPNFPKQM